MGVSPLVEELVEDAVAGLEPVAVLDPVTDVVETEVDLTVPEVPRVALLIVLFLDDEIPVPVLLEELALAVAALLTEEVVEVMLEFAEAALAEAELAEAELAEAKMEEADAEAAFTPPVTVNWPE